MADIPPTVREYDQLPHEIVIVTVTEPPPDS